MSSITEGDVMDGTELFKKGTVFLRSLIGKSACLTSAGKSHEGVIYVVDPCSKVVVLVKESSEDPKKVTSIFMVHAISTISIGETIENASLYKLVKEVVPLHTSPASDPYKKNQVLKWLRKNLIEATEDGDDIMVGLNLRIVHPYNPDNCICNNTIVLDRIRKFMSQMPSGFED